MPHEVNDEEGVFCFKMPAMHDLLSEEMISEKGEEEVEKQETPML